MKGSNIRLLLIGLVIIIVCAVVFMRGDQLVELVETMKQGATLPLIAAICTQLGKYLSQSFAYSHCFKAVNERMKPRSTLPLVFGTFFMNTIAPSLNLAGTTLVVNDARKRGIEAGKATSAALLMQITIDGAFATIMISAFIMLALTVGLSPLWFLVGMLVIVLVSVMILIMVLGRRRPAIVLRALEEELAGAWDALRRTDAKSRLNEYAMQKGVSLRYIEEEKRGEQHSPVFRFSVCLGEERMGEGEGRSKREAQQLAASRTLEMLAAGKRKNKR